MSFFGLPRYSRENLFWMAMHFAGGQRGGGAYVWERERGEGMWLDRGVCEEEYLGEFFDT